MCRQNVVWLQASSIFYTWINLLDYVHFAIQKCCAMCELKNIQISFCIKNSDNVTLLSSLTSPDLRLDSFSNCNAKFFSVRMRSSDFHFLVVNPVFDRDQIVSFAFVYFRFLYRPLSLSLSLFFPPFPGLMIHNFLPIHWETSFFFRLLRHHFPHSMKSEACGNCCHRQQFRIDNSFSISTSSLSSNWRVSEILWRWISSPDDSK